VSTQVKGGADKLTECGSRCQRSRGFDNALNSEEGRLMGLLGAYRREINGRVREREKNARADEGARLLQGDQVVEHEAFLRNASGRLQALLL